MVSVFLVAALLAAGEHSVSVAENVKPATDVRTFCTGKSSIAEGESGPSVTTDQVGFSNEERRVISLGGKQRVLVQDRNGRDELLVEEDGRYRVIVQGNLKVYQLIQSPDLKRLAVSVVYKKHNEMFRAPSAGLYLFDTETWIGEQIVKYIGLSGLSWSPDGKLLAYGDHSKVRFYDIETGKVVESCGIDSQATTDTDERFYEMRWVSDDRLAMTYQNPRGKVGYIVERK